MSRDISLSLIDADPAQPRQYFDEAKITELAESMQANGLIQPIMVRPVGERFVIVHGERRYRAAKSLGWVSIPAEVRELDSEAARWLALVENIQRSDLSPIEEANAYKAMLDTGITQTELGKRIGKGQSYIATKIRLLSLPLCVQRVVQSGELTEGHAKQVLRIKSAPEQQERIALLSIAEAWSVSRIKLEVDEYLRSEDDTPQTPAEWIWWLFRQDGSVPSHDPYPEERLPEEFDGPIEIKTIGISSIVPAMYDCRVARSADTIAWYAEILGTMPPIAVYQGNGEYVLADGGYRLEAAKINGLQQIQCRVYAPKPGKDPKREAFLYAISANAENGLNIFLQGSGPGYRKQAFNRIMEVRNTVA